MPTFDELLMLVDDFFKDYPKYKPALNFAANVTIICLGAYLILDFQQIKSDLYCQAFKPVIEVAKQCEYGVRSDLCYWPAPEHNFSVVNGSRPWNLLVIKPQNSFG